MSFSLNNAFCFLLVLLLLGCNKEAGDSAAIPEPGTFTTTLVIKGRNQVNQGVQHGLLTGQFMTGLIKGTGLIAAA